jgi:hypothetical protein
MISPTKVPSWLGAVGSCGQHCSPWSGRFVSSIRRSLYAVFGGSGLRRARDSRAIRRCLTNATRKASIPPRTAARIKAPASGTDADQKRKWTLARVVFWKMKMAVRRPTTSRATTTAWADW